MVSESLYSNSQNYKTFFLCTKYLWYSNIHNSYIILAQFDGFLQEVMGFGPAGRQDRFFLFSIVASLETTGILRYFKWQPLSTSSLLDENEKLQRLS